MRAAAGSAACTRPVAAPRRSSGARPAAASAPLPRRSPLSSDGRSSWCIWRSCLAARRGEAPRRTTAWPRSSVRRGSPTPSSSSLASMARVAGCRAAAPSPSCSSCCSTRRRAIRESLSSAALRMTSTTRSCTPSPQRSSPRCAPSSSLSSPTRRPAGGCGACCCRPLAPAWLTSTCSRKRVTGSTLRALPTPSITRSPRPCSATPTPPLPPASRLTSA
mmetsp:Transcript_1567/g.5014  ORF Transcript_1567/g.5014 Transcript_1567/m.5014 type:complete len:219 (-) Transcript_1567:169-825(-)